MEDYISEQKMRMIWYGQLCVPYPRYNKGLSVCSKSVVTVSCSVFAQCLNSGSVYRQRRHGHSHSRTHYTYTSRESAPDVSVCDCHGSYLFNQIVRQSRNGKFVCLCVYVSKWSLHIWIRVLCSQSHDISPLCLPCVFLIWQQTVNAKLLE